MNKFKNVLEYVLIIIVCLLIKHYIFMPISVDGNSMQPTLHNNDIMILNKIGYRLNGVNRFDIVVFEYNNERLIKRVIGLPGETIEYKGNKLYVNGEMVEENFDHMATVDFKLAEINMEVIPENCYFVLGDNRLDSIDSRIIGTISSDKVIGKTNFVVFPFTRFGNIRG